MQTTYARLKPVISASLFLGCLAGILYVVDNTDGCLRLQPFREDMTGDGIYSVTDIKEQLKWWLLLPGELIISWIVAWLPKLAQFLELSIFDCRGNFSMIVSGTTWMIVYLAYTVLRELD